MGWTAHILTTTIKPGNPLDVEQRASDTFIADLRQNSWIIDTMLELYKSLDGWGVPNQLSMELTDRELCLWRSSCLNGMLKNRMGEDAQRFYLPVIKQCQDVIASGAHVYFNGRW